MRRRAGPRGFTLLETLVVLVLLAFLMLLIASAFGVARRADVQGERWSRSLNQVDAAQAYLRRALMQAQPRRDALPGRPMPPVFEGDAEHMRFLAPAPMTQDTTGAKFHVLGIDHADGRNWLVLRLARIDPDRPGAVWGVAWGEPQTLAGPLESMAFAYQGVDAAGKPTGWLPSWPWPQRLPRNVRISLRQPGTVAWPTMIVPLVLRSAEQEANR